MRSALRPQSAAESRTVPKVQRSSLGPSPLKISRIVFGSARFRSRDPHERIRIIHGAIEAGITTLDTAPLYEFGEIESLIGRAIQDRREHVEVLSKVGIRWDSDHGDILFESTDTTGRRHRVRRDCRPLSLRRDVEASLTRLRTDRIDLCQIHQPDRLVPIEESLGELSRLVDEGKIREIGVSNFSALELDRATTIPTIGPSRASVVSHQLHYNLLERGPEKDLLPLAREKGLAVLAYSPLEAGVLAGKFLASPMVSRDSSDFRFQTPPFHPSNIARINAALRESIEPIARHLGTGVTQICLAWLLAQRDITGVIAGASSADQVQSIARAGDIKLAPNDLRSIDEGFAQVKIDKNAGLSCSGRTRNLVRRAGRKIKRSLSLT